MQEQDYIKRVQAGDHEAFAYLVDAYETKVYNLCLRMVTDREDARDLTQEAFVKAWRGLRFYKGDASFSTWLYRLTGNVCIDFLRRKKRQAPVSAAMPQDDEENQIDVPDPTPTPEEQTMSAEADRTVAAAMASLEEDFRQILTLRVVQELSYEEIAQIMDMKVGTVKSRLARAREKLRKILLESGNDFGAWASKK